MKKLLAALTGALMTIAAIGGTAAAQTSNSLQALPDAEPEFRMIQPAEVRALLVEAGLTIVSEQPQPAANAHIIIAAAEGFQFVFGFVECTPQGCPMLQMLHPSPTSLAGLNFTPAMANELNQLFPTGALIADGSGNVIYRQALFTAPGCFNDCLIVNMQIFFLSVNEFYGILDEALKRQEVSLDKEFLAGLDRAPIVNVQAGLGAGRLDPGALGLSGRLKGLAGSGLPVAGVLEELGLTPTAQKENPAGWEALIGE